MTGILVVQDHGTQILDLTEFISTEHDRLYKKQLLVARGSPTGLSKVPKSQGRASLESGQDNPRSGVG